MIGLVLVVLLFQLTSMAFRLVSKALATNIRLEMVDFVSSHYSVNSTTYQEMIIYDNSTLTLTQVGIPNARIIAVHATTTMDVFFGLNTIPILLVIMSFVGNVFLNTIIKIKGQHTTPKSLRMMRIVFNVMTVVFAGSLVLFSTGVAIILMLLEMKIVPLSVAEAFFAIMVVVYTIQVVCQAAFTIVSLSLQQTI